MWPNKSRSLAERSAVGLDFFSKLKFFLEMDLPQVPIPHRTADQGTGRVARRTEVAVPEQNLQLKTLLREARR